MPQSTKDLRKLRQKQAAERGEVRERQKPPTQFTVCSICKLQIRLSKKNVELVQHVDSKHPGHTFEQCFPGITHN